MNIFSAQRDVQLTSVYSCEEIIQITKDRTEKTDGYFKRLPNWRKHYIGSVLDNHFLVSRNSFCRTIIIGKLEKGQECSLLKVTIQENSLAYLIVVGGFFLYFLLPVLFMLAKGFSMEMIWMPPAIWCIVSVLLIILQRRDIQQAKTELMSLLKAKEIPGQ